MTTRREFVTQAAVAGGALAMSGMAEARESGRGPAREVYELRRYQTASAAQADRLKGFLADAYLPALKRLGAGPVGVFEPLEAVEKPEIVMVTPFASLEGLGGAAGRLAQDAAVRRAGESFLGLPSSDPPYVRYETAALVAFSGMPRLEVPAAQSGNRPRIFELRTYESHSEAAHAKKVEMFNTGEIALFRRTGLAPVFFGSRVVGSGMPSLTYMVTFEDMAAHDRNWGRFGSDPEWKAMSTKPGYKDGEIVSHIERTFLKPTAFSEV